MTPAAPPIPEIVLAAIRPGTDAETMSRAMTLRELVTLRNSPRFLIDRFGSHAERLAAQIDTAIQLRTNRVPRKS